MVIAWQGSNNVAVGYDEGTVMFKIGREEPVVSMDNSGKIVWARHNEIQTVNVRSINEEVSYCPGNLSTFREFQHPDQKFSE